MKRDVAERWRLANAIMDCVDAWNPGCPVRADNGRDAATVFAVEDFAERGGLHRVAASVELDGIACEDLP